MDRKNELVEVFTEINDYKTMEKFFKEIFTPAEIRDFILRWELMRLLKIGFTQRKIASKLRLSLCKITRGSKILKDRKSVTNQILNERLKPYI